MPSVDERVVQMKFDNNQFESGVSQSEKTLERFKKSLDFKGVEDSIKNLEQAVNKIDLSGLSNAVESIADKFSPLGILGVTAMQKIADAAMDAGKKVADAFLGFSDMSAGQGKYETQTKAVQTITNATGKSVAEVEEVLAKLQKYTDETSYDFAEMVNSIGKFTSVGVELERAERAMEGIASEAAKSGAGKAEANRAMYNFAQALSAGAVKLQDWKSIENANMATKEFKETLIQTAIELGVLQDRGDGVGSIVTTNEEKLKKAEAQLAKAQTATKDRSTKVAAAQEKIAAATKETTVNYQNFNQTLSDGWLTSDVLIATLEKYADTTKEFGLSAYHAAQEALTWSDAIGAVQDAVSSGWMDTFKYLFGDLDEARVLWTDVANSLIGFTDIFTSWRNDVLKSWHEMGGYNDMIEAATNLWQTFMNIVKGVGKALLTVFPILDSDNMAKTLRDATKSLKDWSAGLLEMFGIYQEVEEDEEETAEAADEIKKSIDEVAKSTEEASENMSGLGDAADKTALAVNSIETGLKKGVRGDNVKELQDKLLSLGFRLDKYGADGIFGPETEKAVKELQQALGVEITGVFDEATQAALNTEEGMRKLQERAHKGLGLKDVGKDVKDLQNELNKYLGDNDKLVADGVYGPKTEAAVKELQKQLGVEQTGVWDSATETAYKNNKILLMRIKNMSKQLKEGMKGDDVKKFQEELVKGGYLDSSMADGIYGPKTREAVKALQKELGVTETGAWDNATWHAFHEAQWATKNAEAIEKANNKVAKSNKEITESNDAVKKSAEEVGNASNKTTVTMKKLQDIARGFGSAIKIVSNFAGAVAQVVGNVAGMFKPLIKDVLDFVYIFSGMLENLAEQLEKNGAYKKFVDDITNFFEPIANIVGNAHDAIRGFLESYVDYLKTLDSKTPIKNDTFETFFSFLDEYLEKQGPFGQALKAGIHLIKTLFSVASSVFQIVVTVGSRLFEVGKRIMAVLSPVWSMLSEIFQAGVYLFEALADRLGIFTKGFSESNSFTEWLAKLDEDLPNIQAKVQSFCDTILNFLGLADGIGSIDFNKTIDSVIEAIKKFLGLEVDTSTITDKIDTKGIVETIKDKLIGVYTGIKDWITGFFKGEDIGAVEDGVMKLDGYKISIGVIGVAIALIAKQIYSVTNSIVSIGNNISKVIGNIKGIAKEIKMSKKAENMDTIAGALLKFAATIGVLAASVFVLAQLKWDGLIVGLVGLVAVMGVLIGSIFLLKTILKDADNVTDAIEALGSLGAAIGALSASVVAMSALDWGGLARGLIGTVVLLGACLLFFKLLNKMPLDIKSTGGLIGVLTSLGAALNMLVGAVTALSKLDPGKMIQGLLGLGAIMLGLFAFTKFLGKTRISMGTVAALFTAALAIDMLIGGFLIMSFAMKLLTFTDIVKGIIGITVIVLEMAALLKLIERIRPSIGSILALLPVAISLDLLIAGFSAMVLVMKHAQFGDVVKAFVGIGVLILGIAALLKLIERIRPSIGSILALLPVAISLDLLIGGFIALTIALRNAGIGDMIKAIASIGALVLSVALLTKLMEASRPSIGAIMALIPIAIALDLLVVGFVGLAIAMKTVSASTLIKSIVSLAAIVIALGVVSASIAKVNRGVQGIKAALTIIPLVLGLAGLAAIFALFSKSMKDVSTGTLIKSIVSIEAMVLAIGLLGVAMKSIDIKSTIKLFIAGGALALLIYTFSKALERVKAIDGSKMLAFATSLSELFIAFAIAGGIAGKLGAVNSFFGIIAIAAGIIAVIAAFSALMSIPAVEDFLTNGAEKLGKLVGSFIGAMKAAEFESFNKAIDEMSSVDSVDQSRVNNAIIAAKAVADFGAGLPSKSLINKAADYFFGSELKQFSGDMAAFGKGFNGFAREISSINIPSGDLLTKTANAILIAQSIKQFGESLEKKPITDKIVDAIFGSELKQFSFDMVSFGKGFNGFATQISGINNYSDVSSKTATAISIASSINEFGKSLEKKPISEKIADAIFGSELKQFSSDMVSFGTGFNSYAKQIGLIEMASDLETKTASAISIANSIKEFGESLKEKSIDETITDAIFGSELKQFSGDMVGFSTGFKGYVAQMNQIGDVGDLEGQTGYAIRIADSIRKFSDALKTKTSGEKAADFFFGSELSQFSGDMVTFGTGYNSYAKEMAKIEDVGDLDARTENAIKIASSIRDFSNGLKEKSFGETVSDTIFGSELDQFPGDMSNFASKFNQFTSTMSMIKISPLLKLNVDTAIGIAGQIKSLADGLTGKDIGTKITDAIFGSELSRFSGNMTTFASKFNKFATTMGGITADPKDVESKNTVAISVAEKIASFLETVGGMNIETKHSGVLGWFEKDTTGETVFESLEYLGTAITGAKDDFAGIDASLLTSVNTGIEVVKAVGTLLATFGEEGTPSKIGNGISSFSVIEQLFEDESFGLGAIIKRFSEQISSINNLPEISNIFAGFAGLIGDNQILLDAGSQIAETILEGFSSQFTQENEAFKTAGENLALGLAEGVEIKSEIAVSAVEALAKSMLETVIRVFDSHSPSEETYEQGENFVDGLIKSVGDKTKELGESVEGLGSNALDSLKDVFGGEEGGGLGDNLVETFFGKGEDGISSLENFGSDASNTLQNAFNGEDTGTGIGNDLLNGLLGDGFSSLENAGGNMSDTLKNAFNGEGTGTDMGDDLLDSLFEDSSTVTDESKKYADNVVNEIDNEIESNAGSIEIGKSIDYSTISNETEKHIKLVYGDINEEVRQMQSDLIKLGYNLDKYGADGIFGPETKAALNDFKRDYGLAVNGIFDTEASNKLADALTEAYSQAKYSAAGKEVYENVESGLKSGAEASEKGVANIILDSLKNYKDQFIEQGKEFARNLLSGLVSDSDTARKDAVTIGANFVIGLSEGIIFKSYLVQKAAEYTANLMKNAVAKVLAIQSPSKVGEKLGGYFVSGLAIGQNKNKDEATRASEDAANSMVNTTKKTLSTIYKILDEGIDAQPVIRPVVDLTNVRNAKNEMVKFQNTAFGRIPISTVIAKQIAADIDMSKKPSNHDTGSTSLGSGRYLYETGNGSSSSGSTNGKAWTGSLEDLGLKFDKLSEAVTNMKIVLDTGEFVGATSSAYDRQFGRMTARRERGN